MHINFLSWNKENKTRLKSLGIEIDEFNISPEDVLDPSTTVDYLSKYCIGRISAWKSGSMDIEVLDYDSGNTILIEHHNLEEPVNYNTLLEKFIKQMSHDN